MQATGRRVESATGGFRSETAHKWAAKIAPMIERLSGVVAPSENGLRTHRLRLGASTIREWAEKQGMSNEQDHKINENKY